ncbi:hypothetical protein ACP275_05G052700 [Erythranthe tilingii]
MFFNFSPFLTGVLSPHFLSLFLPFSFFYNLTFKSQLHTCWPFPKMVHSYFIVNQQIPSTAHKINVSYANNPQRSAKIAYHRSRLKSTRRHRDKNWRKMKIMRGRG